jgi:hypothetical protein
MLFLAFGVPIIGVVAASVLSAADTRRPPSLFMTLSRRSAIVAIAPPLAMLIIFYSLAAHMFFALGGWPRSIGEAGFPPTLILHADVAMRFFVTLARIGIFLVPVAHSAVLRPAARVGSCRTSASMWRRLSSPSA